MKEHKKIIKFDKELLIILIALITLMGILFLVEIPGGAFMSFCFGALTFVVIIMYLMYLIDYIPFKIKEKKYYKDLEDELSKESTMFYKFQEQKIYLTDKYIVSVPQFPKHNYNILEYSKLIWIYFDEKEVGGNSTSISSSIIETIDESLSTTIQMIGMDEKHAYVIAEEKRYDKGKDILNKNKEKIKEKILQPTRLDYIMGNKESVLKEVTDKFKEKVPPKQTENEMKNKENILKEISDKIKEKNPQVLVGYTIENKQKYEEIVGNKL